MPQPTAPTRPPPTCPPCPAAARPMRAALLALGLACLPASGQTQEALSIEAIEQNAGDALAVLGMAALPSETASALSVNGGINGAGDTQFRTSQLGGGDTIDGTPIYLEGYIGWNSYDPVYVFSKGEEKSKDRVTWQGVAATGGIGWDFPLSDSLTFRPILNASLGNITSQSEVPEGIGNEIASLLDSGLTVGGLGASAVLAYHDTWRQTWEVDATLRQTQLYLTPIAGDKDVVGDAHAWATGLWSRLRIPTGFSAFQRPLRSVSEFSLGQFGGDQGEVLDTTWLMQAGVGAEFDLAETTVPFVSRARLMLRYTRGDRLQGLSLGFSADF